MISALMCVITGALVLVEKEMDAIVVGRPNPLTGQPSVNYRHADFDRDGLADILLPDRVLLQRGGEFPAALSVPLPLPLEKPEYDVFDSKLYLRIRDRLEVHRLNGMTWERILEQTIEWPDLGPDDDKSLAETDAESTYGTLGHYLHDLSGNGVPEIVVPAVEGLYVYVSQGLGYTAKHLIDIYPAPKVIFPERTQIWPAEARSISFPPSRLRFRLFLDGNSIAVFSKSAAPGNLVRHHTTGWLVDSERGYRPREGGPAVSVTAPIPAYLQPCRLNDDTTPDFAGVRSYISENSLAPERIQEVVLTTDGGKTLQSFRSKSFQTLCVFVDFDGDGDLDCVVESTGLYKGGIREFLTRSLSERTLSHTLAIHFQDAQGRFSKTPDLLHKLSIKLAQPPFRDGPLFTEYQNGGLINITGDLNGDNKRDLVVRTHPERLSIYLNEGLAFSKTPSRMLDIAPDARFGVADVDGDSLSDIVVYRQSTLESGGNRHTVVYFSRMTAP